MQLWGDIVLKVVVSVWLSVEFAFGDTAQILNENDILFGSCYDAPLENQFNDTCIHVCEGERECEDIIFTCYPHDFCTVLCKGNESCHNIHLVSSSSRIDGIELICQGDNACNHIRFQTFDTDLSLSQNLKLYMPYYLNDRNENENSHENSHENRNENENQVCTESSCNDSNDLTDINEYLSSLQIVPIDLSYHSSHDSLNNENMTIEFGKHFMLLKNCLTQEMIDSIRDIGNKFVMREEYSEHREFGDAEGSPYHGHKVIYLNQILSNEYYQFFKERMFDAFDKWQHNIIENDTSNNEIDKLTGFSDIDFLRKYNLKHDWRYFLNKIKSYNARVIEFIDYNINGSLGWHTDDESDITMVALLSKPIIDFNGGQLQFKLQTIDTNIESIDLNIGDLILFPSLADHRVLPVINGSRQVLVIEWWDLPRNRWIGRHDPNAFWTMKNAMDNHGRGFKQDWPLINLNSKYTFINNDNEKKKEYLKNNVTLGDHYILFNSIVSNEMKSEMTSMRNKCIENTKLDISEHRSFGSDKYNSEGHIVTFMNDCFTNDNIYNYFKNVIIAGFDYLQYKCMVNESCDTPQYVNEKLDVIWKNGKIGKFEHCYFIENVHNMALLKHFGWKHDWYSLFQQSNSFESRVIEYIVYDTNGTLGWHTDDDSQLTMVVLINNGSQYDGGTLQFRSHSGDDDIESVTLNDGDMIVFPSMADHRVLPINDGKRIVLVIEWWIKPRNEYFDTRLTPMDFDIRMRCVNDNQSIQDCSNLGNKHFMTKNPSFEKYYKQPPHVNQNVNGQKQRRQQS